MWKRVFCAASALFISSSAWGADISSPVKAPPAPVESMAWDVSFGLNIASDYIIRGISQTNGNAAIQGYAEVSVFDWVYFGAWGSNVSFMDSGSAEVDVYGGLRHKWDRLTLDVGIVGYLYPGSTADTNFNFWEVYFKPKYDVTDKLTIGAKLYYTTEHVARDADGTYLAGVVELALPSFGPGEVVRWLVSGEFGHQWTDSNVWNATFLSPITLTPYYVDVSGYNYWNVGTSFMYRAAKLDLRYHGSDLNSDQCAVMAGNRDNCGNRFLASLSFNTSFSQLK